MTPIRTLESINKEIEHNLRDQHSDEHGIQIEGFMLEDMNLHRDACEMDFDKSPHTEIGWIDPTKGIGIYLSHPFSFRDGDMDHIKESQELLKKMLTSYLNSLDGINRRITYTFKEQIELIPQDQEDYLYSLDINITLIDHKYNLL